jgi:hypothetical protein
VALTPEVPNGEISRRRLIGLSAAVSAGLLGSWAASPAAAAAGLLGSAVPSLGNRADLARLLRDFASPPRSTAPKFRWWWPNGQVSPAELAREVDAVADAGFGGLEVADVHHSGLVDLDVEHFGWGSPPWIAGLERALTQAARRGITLDLSMGPSWPAAVPTITPDSPAASQELAHGVVTVPAGTTYAGPVPASVLPAGKGVTRQTILAVQAARVVGTPTATVTTLDPSSVVDLTATVAGTQITWTAPTDGPWVLLGYWLRGSGQEPEAGPHTSPTSYVVDHFSSTGLQASTGYWDRTILSSRIRKLLKQAGGAFFEDSLEIETTSTIWTPVLLTEFRRQTGYELLPYLPAVLQLKGKYPFSFGTSVNNHLRDDVNTVLSNLYRDHHLLALKSWAHDLGMQLRVQPYGLSTDSLQFAGLLDIPEGESLGFKNLDDYRVLSGGRDLAGHSLLSCEAICYANGAYSTTWGKALQTIGSFYAGGVNQTVIHGFAYADAPGATWPGFAAFSPYNVTGIGYGEAWGPRQPTWAHMSDVAGYLSRSQLALRTGAARYDVLFYRQKGYSSTGIGAPWATNDGIPIGWTHSFATDAALADVTVKGRRLAPNGPAFKALVLGPDQFNGNEFAISTEGATRLLGYARAGLPIVVLGAWDPVIATGLATESENTAVRTTIVQLLKEPTVRQVSTQDLIPAALAELGVVPAVQYTSSSLMSVHRLLAGTDLYYLANARHAENRKITTIDQIAWLTPTDARSVPFRLDAWTGTVEPIAEFVRQDGRIGVRVTLDPGESTIVVLAEAGPSVAPAVIATTADSVRLDGPTLRARSTHAGTFDVTLADGRVRHSTIAAVPDPVDLTEWTLDAEDWQPGADAARTLKPVVHLSLAQLQPWSAIPELVDASGIGHYRTTVTLPSSWRAEGTGAILDLGTVSDTFRVTVNGAHVPSSGPLNPRLDIGDRLRPGKNVITVEVATTLLNRLRTVTPAVYGIATRQAYGLIGPVRLLPYVESAVR